MKQKETISAKKRTGLGILDAKPHPKENWGEISLLGRGLTEELRERYWIKRVMRMSSNVCVWNPIEMRFFYDIERHDLGKNRNEPGDGFSYNIVWTKTSGMRERAEWFEVTEVVEGVKPQEIKKFMRIENGMEVDHGFDTDQFLHGLNLGIPCRAAQRRAADKVIAAVEKKLNKRSYKDMSEKYGYGTLIVGLPLWFAMPPLAPLRVENVIDNFNTRIKIGLEKYKKQLRKKDCPFWRIVVIWEGSKESVYEWKTKAKIDVYNDPVYKKISVLHVPSLFLLPKIDDIDDIDDMSNIIWSVTAKESKKQEKFMQLSSIAKIDRMKRLMEFMEERKFRDNQKRSFIDQIKLYGILRLWAILCFVRVYHLSGLKRKVIAKISPSRWIMNFVIKHRALRLYKASQRKQRKN